MMTNQPDIITHIHFCSHFPDNCDKNDEGTGRYSATHAHVEFPVFARIDKTASATMLDNGLQNLAQGHVQRTLHTTPNGCHANAKHTIKSVAIRQTDAKRSDQLHKSCSKWRVQQCLCNNH
jgi:hypothetical protein